MTRLRGRISYLLSIGAKIRRHVPLGTGLALMLDEAQMTWSMETFRTLKSSPHLLLWVIPFHALQALLGELSIIQ